MGRMLGRGLGLALALVAGVGTAEPIQAQVVIGSEQTECRCVDADGNRIENCTCLRQGNLPLRSFTLSGMGLDRRAQIGVYIERNQDDGEIGGVRITEVQEDSPAEDAGMRAGDIVLSIGGVSVLSELDEDRERDLDGDASLATQRFVKIVGDLEPEQEVEMILLRNGSRVTIEVEPEAASGVFTLRGLDGEGLVQFGRNFEFDEEERRALEESLGAAREQLRGFNFRFDERGQERLREQAEIVEEQARRMQELAEVREDEMRELEIRVRGLQEGREVQMRALAEEYERGRLFETTMDPCVEMYSEGASRIMIRGGDGCIDGLRLADMNEGLAVYFGTDSGVLVTEVSESSSLGLEAGDVVLRVGDRNVEDVSDLRRILQSYDTDESVNLRVRRDNREIQVSGMRRGN